ncbi:hypothetical protein [Niabella hibiscisoli]|uniref:hypothetical protein n=1 Tax=Niabella hibiscisoli TaxID=1825928 RepID=UPI001F112F0C|nr:hypothetical protein [Niabella hibiscisoli]MCH5716102.1 hypothetical protein [Niabella hibiscisoli]
MKPVNLNPEALEQLQQVAAIIVKQASLDKIWLLGSTVQHQHYESIFHDPAASQQWLSGCTLLILLPELAHKEPHQWQDQIEQHCSPLLHVTTLVQASATFIEWLRAGHPLRCAYGNRDLCYMMRELFTTKLYLR